MKNHKYNDADKHYYFLYNIDLYYTLGFIKLSLLLKNMRF